MILTTISIIVLVSWTYDVCLYLQGNAVNTYLPLHVYCILKTVYVSTIFIPHHQCQRNMHLILILPVFDNSSINTLCENAYRIADPLCGGSIDHRWHRHRHTHTHIHTQSFAVLFGVDPKKLLNNQLSCRWFQPSLCSSDVTRHKAILYALPSRLGPRLTNCLQYIMILEAIR